MYTILCIYCVIFCVFCALMAYEPRRQRKVRRNLYLDFANRGSGTLYAMVMANRKKS